MPEDVDALKSRITHLENLLNLYLRESVALRTSLSPIKGFVSMLLEDSSEKAYSMEDRLEFYSIIEENVDRIARIIQDILNVARIEKLGLNAIELNMDLVDLRKIVDTVVTTQQIRTSKHSFVVDFDPETILIEADIDKIQSILHNLVNNAIRYSPEGGEVRITAKTELPSEQYPAGTLLMNVKDQGIGLPKHVLEHKDPLDYALAGARGIWHEGTGMGLYLGTSWVRRHGGEIWPTSDGEGKGTTFWFRIPLRQPPAQNIKNG